MDMGKVILHTERLDVEIIQEEHFEDLFKLVANPIVQKYFPKTLNRKETEEFLERIQRSQREQGYSFYAVKKKSDGCFIGICGLLPQEIDGVKEIEVAYRFDNQYWGQGYATEAAKACMRYARDTLKVQQVISIILPSNHASIRVAIKNGLKLEKTSMFMGSVVNVYRKVL